MPRHPSLMIRILAASLVGATCGAIIGAAGFALSEMVFGRGIGILGSSPLLGAVAGAVSLGICGGGTGALIGILGLRASRGAAVGTACGVLLIVWERWSGGTRYFYDHGYVDRQLFVSDLVYGATVVIGCALAAVAASAFLRTGSRTGK